MARDEGRDDGVSIKEKAGFTSLLGTVSYQDDNGNLLAMVPLKMMEDPSVEGAVAPFMLSALKHGIEGYGPQYYMGLCASGRAQLWVGINGSVLHGIMVTMKIEYSKFSVLRVLMCAGRDGSLAKFRAIAWNALVEWAQYLGATNIETWGRPGWGRALQDYARPEKKIEVLSYKVPAA